MRKLFIVCLGVLLTGCGNGEAVDQGKQNGQGVYQGEDESRWKSATDSAQKAYDQGDYGEAEKFLKIALEEAEKFGPEEERLAASLNNLAQVYRAQGKYAEAEPLHKRSLAIQEKALGPEDLEVAQTLNNLAMLYRSRRAPHCQSGIWNAVRQDRFGRDGPRTCTMGQMKTVVGQLTECGDLDHVKVLVGGASVTQGYDSWRFLCVSSLGWFNIAKLIPENALRGTAIFSPRPSETGDESDPATA